MTIRNEERTHPREAPGQQDHLVSGRRFLLAIALTLLLAGGIGTLTFAIVHIINPHWMTTVDFVVLVVAEVYVSILAALLIAFGGPAGVRDRLAFRYTSSHDLLLALGVLVLVQGVRILIYVLLSPIIGSLPNTLLQEFRLGTDLSRLPSADALAMGLIVVRACLLAPIGEELLFRGALFGWLRRRLSARYTILITALLFSITSLSFPGVLIIFLDGIATSWVREHTGSSLNVAVMHIINDTLMLSIAYVLVAQHIAK